MPDPQTVPKIEDRPNEPVFYTNIAAIRATPDEIIIHFGLREEDPKIANGVAKAVLSLPHAKRLAVALVRVIEGYERTFGEVIADEAARLTPEGRRLFGVANTESGEKND